MLNKNYNYSLMSYMFLNKLQLMLYELQVLLNKLQAYM